MKKKILGVVGIVLCLTYAMEVFATQLEWKTKTPMPTARSYLAAASLNGKIYAIGGSGGENVVEEYNPVTGSWTTKSPMPTARCALSAVAVNGKIYAIGGLSGGKLNVVEEYDSVTGSWTTKSPMPTARYDLSAVAVNGKIYAIGGYSGGKLNVVEEYDPVTGSWTTKSPMPTARSGLSAVAVNGKIYAIGGVSEGYLSVVEEYDPVTGSWTTKSPMPTARSGLSAVAVNGKIYAIGGAGGENVVEEYDPVTGSWATKTLMPTARCDLAAVAVNGKIYAIGGVGGGYLNVVEEATLGAPVDTNITNGGDAGTLTVADAKGDAILTFSGIGGTKTITCAATTTTILQGYGIGYLASPNDQAVMPTATVYYPYEVSNSSNGTDTITIESTWLDGATWTIALIDDTNQDGFRQPDENTPLPSQIILRQNESRKFFLKVDVSIAGSATMRVRAQSSTSDSWGDVDMRYDETLTFARGYGVRLSSPVDLTGSPSTTVYYTYRLTNSGNATDTITLSASNIAGGNWELTILQDDNHDGIHQATETTQIGSITLPADSFFDIFLKVDIPAAEIGATSTNKIVAQCSETDTVSWGDADVVEDITITLCSAPTPYLTLAKYVSPADPQLPGATLTYTLKYKNEGTAEAINVMIQDVIPAWATYVANSGTGTVGTGGGSNISVSYDDNTKVITFTINGTVQSQGYGECRFSVVIK